MPNWCINDLVVSHDDPKKMDEFRKVVEMSMDDDSGAGDSICSHFYPEPNYEEEEVEDVFPRPDKTFTMPNWWNWRVAHWGTKWSERSLEVIEDKKAFWETGGNTMHLSFMTAWSPPRGVVQKMVEQGFSTEFWYMEQGSDYWGYHLDGEEIHFGSPTDYHLDAWGNSLEEWNELPEGAKGKGKKIEKTREQRIDFNSEETETITYHIWEHDWWETAKPSKKKGLELGISEEIWNKCALGEIRGG